MNKVRIRSAVVENRLLRNGMTQKQLAFSIGLSAPALSQILSGKRGAGPKSRKSLLSCPLFSDLTFDDLFIIEGERQAA